MLGDRGLNHGGGNWLSYLSSFCFPSFPETNVAIAHQIIQRQLPYSFLAIRNSLNILEFVAINVGSIDK
jgi:hypothetical protein